MPLDWVLITKLAKLANHNSNDNEANAAARRVCKLLEAGDFDGKTTAHEKPRNRPPEPQPQAEYHYKEEGFWNDPDFKSIFEEYVRGNRPNPFRQGSYEAEEAENQRRVRQEEERYGWYQRDRERAKEKERQEKIKRQYEEQREKEEKEKADKERRRRDKEMEDTILREPRSYKKDPSGWS